MLNARGFALLAFSVLVLCLLVAGCSLVFFKTHELCSAECQREGHSSGKCDLPGNHLGDGIGACGIQNDKVCPADGTCQCYCTG
jgi:hypothetical protein